MRYLDLIFSLLQCPGGQEMMVLNAHADLVDPDLLVAMKQVAADFERKGNPNIAQWLIKLSNQIAQTLIGDENVML